MARKHLIDSNRWLNLCYENYIVSQNIPFVYADLLRYAYASVAHSASTIRRLGAVASPVARWCRLLPALHFLRVLKYSEAYLPPQLVIAGYDGWCCISRFAPLQQVRKDVRK